LQRRKRREATESQDNAGGSVWTSYSDLFMTVAVVFLVMFIFAMLSSSMSQMSAKIEKEKSEEKLRAQMPNDLAKANKDRLAKIKLTIDSIDDTAESIQKSVDQVKKLATDVADKKVLLASLYNDQILKDGMLNQAKDRIVNSENHINDLDEKLVQRTQKYIEEKRKANRLALKVVNLEETKNQQNQKIADMAAVQKKYLSTKSKLSKSIKNLENEIISSRKKQDSSQITIANLESQISRQKRDISKQKSEINSSQSSEKQLKTKLHMLNKTLQKSNDENLTQEKAINSQSQQVAALNQKISELNTSVKQTQSNNGKLQGELKKSEQDNKTIQGQFAASLQDNESLKGQLLGSKARGDALAKEGDSLRGEIGKLKSANGRTQGQLGTANSKIGKLSGQIGQLQGELGAEKDGRSKAEGKAGDLAAEGRKKDSTINDLMGELDAAAKSNSDLNKTVKYRKKELGKLAQKIAGARNQIGRLANARELIASKIANNLRASGIDISADPVTGKITIAMDDAFYFGRGSAELTSEAKTALGKIIPLYAQTVLGQQEDAKKIRAVTITGHASPRFRKQFVNPEGEDPEAYAYNLGLSMNRAQQIADYMFGKEIGNYDHKSKLRVLTKISGAGYMDPVIPANQDNADCGVYSCERSRRVEINFLLQEPKGFQKDLEKISNSL
jgi:chromosome segregation ATPase